MNFQPLFKTVRKIFIVILLMLGITFAFLYFADYSDGYRAGTMIKISEKGYIFKTYEGQLYIGNVISGQGNLSTSIWDFTIGSGEKDVLQKLDEAMLNGRRVKLHYKEKYTRFPWRGDTKYFIYKVEQESK